MPYLEQTTTSELDSTLENARGVTRRHCPHRPLVDVAVRPHFGCFPAMVRDISEEGIGLCCLTPIEPGTGLLFRLEPEGRHVPAQVVHATRVRDGWLIGCAFAETLTDQEVSAYVGSGSFLERAFA
jgi:hypothetical protein